jgi:hypothetical protein
VRESPVDIRLGALVAQGALGTTANGIDLAVKPAVDTFGASYTSEQRATETADAKRTGRRTAMKPGFGTSTAVKSCGSRTARRCN